MADTEDYEEGGAMAAHASTHENGGSDEIEVTGLSGTLADPQTPAAHGSSHEDAGADELILTGMVGLLATDQHVIDAEVLAVAEDKTKKGAASGYASLDATTKVPTAELGTGTADATTFLRGDRSWQAPSSGGITMGKAIAAAMIFG